MSRSVGDRLPGQILELLDGHEPAASMGLTVLLLTTNADDWPQVAMLSAGEVLALHASELRLALWPGSGATRNLTSRSRATLMLVTGDAGYYLRVRTHRLSDITPMGARLAVFGATVDDVLVDEVDYATLVSGIEFRLLEPEAVLARWVATLEALRGV
jgi:hypothetical protein